MDYPVTAAVRVLRSEKVNFIPHLYTYEERGGAEASSAALGVPLHNVIKTLVMENENKQPLVVLMHGDAEVSTKALARQIGCKNISPCTPETANKHSGYLVGGTSPLGTKKQMPVYAEKTILDCNVIYINGGKRGFLVEIKPAELNRVLKPIWVEAAQGS